MGGAHAARMSMCSRMVAITRGSVITDPEVGGVGAAAPGGEDCIGAPRSIHSNNTGQDTTCPDTARRTWIGKSNPPFGRRTAQSHLRPFGYPEYAKRIEWLRVES